MLRDMINKISIREIKSSFKRFLSIILMSLLGVGTFVGLSSTAPDMINSLDKYYDRMNCYDIKVLSTLGFSDKTIESIKSIDGIKDAQGVYSKDVLVNFKGIDNVVKVISINDSVNKLELLDGALPQNKDEIAVEALFLSNNKLKLNDYVNIIDKDNSFYNKKLKIVGVIKSPLFITSFKAMPDRGNTNLGNGKVNYYSYVLEDNFNLDYWTELYITVKNSKEEITNSKEYNKIIEEVYNKIKDKKDIIEKDRFNEIYSLYKDKIDEEKEKNLKQLNDAKDLLDNSKKELNIAKIKLDKGSKELDLSNKKLIEEKNKIDNGRKDLDSFLKELNNAKETLDYSKKQVEQELNNYGLSYNFVIDLKNVISKDQISKDDVIKVVSYYDENGNIINTVNNIYNFNLNDLVTKEDIINSIPNNTDNYDIIINTINAIYNFDINNYKYSRDDLINLIPKSINNYDEIINTINYYYDNSVYKVIKDALNNTNNIDYIISNLPNNLIYRDYLISVLNNIKSSSSKVLLLDDSISKIEDGYKEYYKNKALYDHLLVEYENGLKLYNEYLKKYNDGLSKYKDSYKKYTSGLNIYNEKIEEYYNARKLFDSKIEDAYKQLDNIPESKLYLYNRLDSTEYSSYIDDSQSVANLSTLFPTVFFIVAVLISLVSMSRMVEDDRSLLGTLKSIGFFNNEILKKYLIYSFLATLIGGVIGSILGFYLLSHYIFNMYKLLFSIDKFIIYYDLKYIILGISISVLCICGTTLITVFKNVKEKPASLMRPKAPPSGKRVLLEHFTSIWKRLSFSNKITIRNLFRYKKRAFLTIIGIIGCTSLLLAGFAIRDSIVNIPEFQYNKVWTFDEMAYLSNDSNVLDIFSREDIKNYTEVKITTGTNDKNNINLFVPKDDKELLNILKLKDYKTKKDISLKDNGVIISDKLSELTNKKVGDYIDFTDSSGKKYKFLISSVFENYVGHYIIMNNKTYQKEIGDYSTNVVFYNLKNKNNEEKVNKDLLNNPNVMSILSVISTKRQVDNMLKVLDSVVLILIILSGGLSLVVLYNLSFINISERRREIATLKVLGFTHREVDNYINKETIILTIIGIAFGLLFGVFLSNIIISTVEISMVRFIHKIEIISYFMTSIIILVFTFIINGTAHFSLKKIDMIESLKSVE